MEMTYSLKTCWTSSPGIVLPPLFTAVAIGVNSRIARWFSQIASARSQRLCSCAAMGPHSSTLLLPLCLMLYALLPGLGRPSGYIPNVIFTNTLTPAQIYGGCARRQAAYKLPKYNAGAKKLVARNQLCSLKTRWRDGCARGVNDRPGRHGLEATMAIRKEAGRQSVSRFREGMDRSRE